MNFSQLIGVMALIGLVAEDSQSTSQILSTMITARTWGLREEALHTVLKTSSLGDPEVQKAIIRLFERETGDPKWREEAEFTDFNDYYGELMDLTKEIAEKTHEKAAWRALVYSTYNPSSEYGEWLASQPDAFPFLLEMLHSQDTVLSGLGSEMISETIANCEMMKDRCPKELRDKRDEFLVRLREVINSGSDHIGEEILALGNCGDSSNIPFLEAKAMQLQARNIDPNDQNKFQNRNALVWLMRRSEKRIKERIAAAAADAPR
jgi:hypothetical protein